MGTLLDIGTGRVVTVAVFYKASELLGVGRYSEVYKAFDTQSQSDAALKLYVGFDPQAHETAKNEASTLARIGQLNSEYFPKLRRSAWHRIQNRNHPLLVLELGACVGSDGQKSVFSLKNVIPQSGATPATIEPDAAFWEAGHLVRWIIHLVQAVKQLHDISIVHRDLKPANILVKRGLGQSASVPLFLDFNSAAPSVDSHSVTGTPRYLPPEVTSRKRQAPAPADDLWGVAMVAWEMIHGLGTSPDQPSTPHTLVNGSIPSAVIDILRRALSIAAEARFPQASDLLTALEAAARVESDSPAVLNSDEVARARSAMERIKRTMAQSLAPPGEIVVPKEIHETVTTVIAWLSQEDTQSLDLVDELVRLGPLAIPVCLQQGYRLSRQKAAYVDVVQAIVKLGGQDFQVAQRSIDKYALSSNIGVRALCWRVCEELRYFPEMMLDSLKGDEGVLLAEERLKIADLCIKFSKKRSAVLGLVKYMCREYILNPDRYRDLSSTVARRIHELQLRDESTLRLGVPERSAHVQGLITPLLIAEDTHNRVWRELKEFDELPQTAELDVEGGLVELMADAFATTGAAGLEILRVGKVPRFVGPTNLPVFRRFAAKLGASNEEARSWLISEAERRPSDWELQKVVEKLEGTENPNQEAPNSFLAAYLTSGDRKAFNKLRFWKGTSALNLVNAHLSRGASDIELDRFLQLLKGYQTRSRPAVVDVVLAHWVKLSARDYSMAVDVLTAYSVPDGQRKRAIDLLNAELGGRYESIARRGLDNLLR